MLYVCVCDSFGRDATSWPLCCELLALLREREAGQRRPRSVGAAVWQDMCQRQRIIPLMFTFSTHSESVVVGFRRVALFELITRGVIVRYASTVLSQERR